MVACHIIIPLCFNSNITDQVVGLILVAVVGLFLWWSNPNPKVYSHCCCSRFFSLMVCVVLIKRLAWTNIQITLDIICLYGGKASKLKWIIDGMQWIPYTYKRRSLRQTLGSSHHERPWLKQCCCYCNKDNFTPKHPGRSFKSLFGKKILNSLALICLAKHVFSCSPWILASLSPCKVNWLISIWRACLQTRPTCFSLLSLEKNRSSQANLGLVSTNNDDLESHSLWLQDILAFWMMLPWCRSKSINQHLRYVL